MGLKDLFNFSVTDKTLSASGVLKGMTDHHSHLLPGVDDGVKTVEGAEKALRLMEGLGVKKVYITPHVMENFPDNNRESLTKRFEEFKTQVDTSIELNLAAEYMLDSSFENHLKDGLMTIGDNRVLIETSYIAAPLDLDNMIFEVMAKGYVPVLAHPERYVYMVNDDYISLASRNVKLQLNLMSLSGCYGRTVSKKAMFMLENGMYSFAGSDCHDAGAYERILNSVKIPSKYLKLVKALLHD